jgi:hypothetical protein
MSNTRQALALEARTIGSMAAAVRWAAARVPPATFVTAVAQDEFTFDVVVRVDAETYLVFDTT